jgi:MFS transporter, MHS family, proline/betaine transporter
VPGGACDFAVYGFFAVTIGKVFFPTDSDTASLLSSLAVYGVAFLIRPLGGLVLGAFGDRHGRRAALSLTVILMGISTTLVAVLPSYESVGFLAPVLLIALRCAQGFSAGGEWTGTSAFLVEYAPRGRRALWGSVVSATAAMGTLAGALVAVALAAGIGLFMGLPETRGRSLREEPRFRRDAAPVPVGTPVRPRAEAR